jgi:crotonobetainyl-CoA:carnitine CoA-transferase CaiB-like acyl-CoA transferase
LAAPLDDVTVITIESYMATPSASAILADLGANVIKVEPLSGDPMRGLTRVPKVDGPIRDLDAQFDVDNRGKRSVSVALDTVAGQGVVHRLVSHAQMFMCNLLIERQQRFCLDPDTLLSHNPALVHATLTGYGTTGPDAWRPGYDVTAFFGRSGLYDASREGDDGIVPMARPAQGDHTAGLALLGAALAALRMAERTGEGQVVETSLFETAIWTQATDFGITAIDHAPVRRRSRHHQLTPMANRYPCGDGKWVVFNMMDAEAWPRLCRAIDREEWIADERYQTPRMRYDRMPELVDGVDAALSSRGRDEWGEIFDESGVIWGPVLTLDEVAQDAQAHAIGMFPELDHPDLGRYRTVSAPMRFKTADVRPRRPAPELAADTRDVLRTMGMSDAEVTALVDQGVVGDGA